MNNSNMKWKNNHVEPVSLRRPVELMSLAPQTGYVRMATANGEVPLSTANTSSNNSNFKTHGLRETGYIEKLMHSYGFLQCCMRKDRLFFHFSEFKGDIHLLNIGDVVEFQESVDEVKNKPIAVSVVRVPCAKKSGEIVSEKAVVGTVLTIAKSLQPIAGDGEMTRSTDGSVSYEQSGEVFFLSFSVDDVDGNEKLHVGDQVEFFISTDERNSNLRARKLRRAAGTNLTMEVYQGVICSLKENFGFIERADVVKEIFFHFSEFQGNIDALNLDDDVEFNIQTRLNKEVAVCVHPLPRGTVMFEDVSEEPIRGKIVKQMRPAHGRRQSDPSWSGKIVYESENGSAEIVFRDDSIYDYTMMEGDLVEFLIATDRRDKLQHATSVRLLEETFAVRGETREKGFITTIKEAFGFIRCTDREARMFFHFSEMLDDSRSPQPQDEVEFTVIEDPTDSSRLIAVRIRYLPKGTISLENCPTEKYTGTVEKESGTQRTVGQDQNPGIIMYEIRNAKHTILYSTSAVDGNLPKLGDKVEFQVAECHKTRTKSAVNVRVVGRPSGNKEYGFLVTVKDSFGFIETADHEREIFFHFSSLEGDINDFELGDEVEFTVSQKGGKVNAESVRRLTRKQLLLTENILPEVLDGRILKPLAVGYADQSDYSGQIQVISPEGDSVPDVLYPFGIMSLVDKRDLPQKNDVVRFQVAASRDGGRKRAVRVARVNRYIHARVESVTSESGTLSYEKLEGRLPFQLSDVLENSELAVGDEVEFVVVQNLHGVRSAFNVRKTCEKPRPERLLARLRSVADDQGPKVVAIRAPRGPDGSKGFKVQRKPIPATTTPPPIDF